VPHAVGELVCGRYEIRSAVGEQPLGAVYQAHDRQVGVDVQLHVIAAALVPDEGARQVFVQKLGRARALSHSNLVRLHDVAIDLDDSVVVTTQWAPGRSLRQHLEERGGTLSVDEARPILSQIGAGLAHAHQQGVVVGDLRLDSVLLYSASEEGGVKLSNVGIALALPRRRFLEAMQGTESHTYLAPEVRAGRVAEARADVFSFAALTARLVTGRPHDELPPGALPPALAPVLSRALADDPLIRHASVERLTSEVEAVLATGAPPRPERRTPPPHQPPPRPAPPSGEVPTRQVPERELRQMHGLAITRRVPEHELFPLRVQSSDALLLEAPYEPPPDTERTLLPEARAFSQLPELEEEPAPSRVREVEVVSRPPPRLDPLLATVEVTELPVEILPPRARSPFASLPPPEHRTPTVLTMLPRRHLAARRVLAVAVAVIAAGVLASVVLGLARRTRAERLLRERAAKQLLADQLNARAEVLRHNSVAPAVVASPCPLGAQLVDGRDPFCIDLYEYPGENAIPRTGVGYERAEELCLSRGERLCGDAEWERACRGKGGASYPYGQAYDPARCNTKGGDAEIAPAGSFADCRSAAGAYDMSGNVAEWVAGPRGPLQKGGSARPGGSTTTRCSHTIRNPPPEGGPMIGFRCCADPAK
jgi:serine/threonine protein kinase